MSEATIRAAIKACVDTVGSEGVVHDYQRWNADWPAFLTLFKTKIGSQDYIRGWCISCTGNTNADRTLDGGVIDSYEYTIRGIWGLDDSAASEKTALAKAIEIRDALRADATLGAFWDAEPASIPVFEARMFGDVLVHYTEIRQVVKEAS